VIDHNRRQPRHRDPFLGNYDFFPCRYSVDQRRQMVFDLIEANNLGHNSFLSTNRNRGAPSISFLVRGLPYRSILRLPCVSCI
jgi:hypothetical protein